MPPYLEAGDAQSPVRRHLPLALSAPLGLPEAARHAAAIFARTATADPDPLLLAELTDRVARVPALLFTLPSRRLTAQVLADWRRAEEFLDRRLSPAVRSEVLAAAGYLSFYLGLLAVDGADDTSARRFATLAEQHADHLGDPLLAGTVAGLDATIALAGRLPEAAAASAKRMAAAGHGHLAGWAAVFEANAASWLGDADTSRDALRRLREHRPAPGGPYPGWPPISAEWVTRVAANVLAVLGDPAGTAAAEAVVKASDAGSSERAWALAARAAAAMAYDPDHADHVFGELVDLLGRWPSRLLVQWAADTLRAPVGDDPDGTPSAGPTR